MSQRKKKKKIVSMVSNLVLKTFLMLQDRWDLDSVGCECNVAGIKKQFIIFMRGNCKTPSWLRVFQIDPDHRD